MALWDEKDPRWQVSWDATTPGAILYINQYTSPINKGYEKHPEDACL